MADGSKIEWTDATWNVVIGCDKVSPGCDHCYAIRTAHRMQANPNPVISAAYAGTEADGEWTGLVNLVETRLDLPLRWRRSRRIFVNAQSDLFHSNVPDEFIARVWAVMALAPQHTFQILTKRHARMRALLRTDMFHELVQEAIGAQVWGGGVKGAVADTVRRRNNAWLPLTPAWPLPNVWLGVSVEDQKRADLRIPALLDTPAAVRWLSCEPLLGPVNLRLDAAMGNADPGINWVVVGGESGQGARPMHPAWARTLRDECQDAGVPFLFKQWGEYAPIPQVTGPDLIERVGKRAAGRVLDGRTWDEYPAAADG